MVHSFRLRNSYRPLSNEASLPFQKFHASLRSFRNVMKIAATIIATEFVYRNHSDFNRVYFLRYPMIRFRDTL